MTNDALNPQIEVSNHPRNIDADLTSHNLFVETGIADVLTQDGKSPKESLLPSEAYKLFRTVGIDRYDQKPLYATNYNEKAKEFWKAARRVRKQNPRTAIEYYRQALLESPRFHDAGIGLSAAYIEEGNLDAAEIVLHRLRIAMTSERDTSYRELLRSLAANLGYIFLERAIHATETIIRQHFLNLSDVEHRNAVALFDQDIPGILADWALTIFLSEGNSLRARETWQRACVADPERKIVTHTLSKYPEIANLETGENK